MKKSPLKILAINPGSTSTKVALFQDTEGTTRQNLEHSPEELNKFDSIWSQLDFRLAAIEAFLSETLSEGESLDGVAGRGGLLRPVPGGVYEVNADIVKDAEVGYQGEHASNLGCALAEHIAQQYDTRAFIVDPVSTDEMEDIARISGHPAIERRGLSHALNLHYVACKASESAGLNPVESKFVIAHLGGGISVAPVDGGRIIDVNDANNEGPFSTTRSGTLPPVTLGEWIVNSEFTINEVRNELLKKSGLLGYLGIADGKEIQQRIENGDSETEQIICAMAYQVAKEIAAMSSVLCGNVDSIILTGGLAKLPALVQQIIKRTEWIAPVTVMAGEYEMEALANGVYRVLTGKDGPKHYPSGETPK
ncbi:MAG: butyrate kinase [Candidatus Marinimicrobia bacterium]|nr:butyrate kinase [Candidatus Neomarinimicrobiota bacterium]MCF7829965.1 butyrate kinase [Candidatus Neomarinimicrobiota bacterium]MCF7881881.1 butyrate kinase [Candidatus Neomarinimicrobiota bacterium]